MDISYRVVAFFFLTPTLLILLELQEIEVSDATEQLKNAALANASKWESRHVGPEVGPNPAFYRCVPTGMHGPTCILWVNLTAFSLAMCSKDEGNWSDFDTEDESDSGSESDEVAPTGVEVICAPPCTFHSWFSI